MNTKNNDRDLQVLLEHLRRTRSFDFGGYKRTSLERRIQKRMQTVHLTSYPEYLGYLEVHPEEFQHLFNTILINVTDFFRDKLAWDYIESHVVPGILENKGPHDPIRVWSAGVASGEEAYSIAIVLAEALGVERFQECVKIYASDVDEDALNQARQAVYTAKALSSLSPEVVKKYFEPHDSHYIFRKDLRRSIIFGRHDLVSDAPISRIDLLICRNVLMYLNTETQSRVLRRFHFALNDNGFLFVGKAEMLFTHNNLFESIELKRRVFAKVPAGVTRNRLFPLEHIVGQDTPSYIARHVRLREAALEASPLAQITIDLTGSLSFANAAARNLFGLTAKDVGRLFNDLELSRRINELPARIPEAYAERNVAVIKNADWTTPEGQTYTLQGQIIPLKDANGSLLGVTVTFTDVGQFRKLQKELEHSNQELETAYEELQSTNEELETTNEELQSTIEELETINEELQSTNEELETINEELQSTNEELETTNDELRRRTEELNNSNAFLNSILAGIRGGVVVINPDFMVQVWNERAQDLWGLRAEEVRGRNLLNLDIGLPVDELRQALRKGLEREYEYYEVVIPARNRRGRDFQCQVMCTPLVNANNTVQGVILVMEELQSTQQGKSVARAEIAPQADGKNNNVRKDGKPSKPDAHRKAGNESKPKKGSNS